MGLGCGRFNFRLENSKWRNGSRTNGLSDYISFEGPSNTKENMIMDLKLEYQTFRAKPSKSLSQTYTPYKTLFNELTNDGVTLSKHDMNVTFVNSLPEKWLSFSQGLRNAIILRPLTLSISMK
nr:retrovirus-related Pol polyprotein from transposon TNT 1-94 [Tanacetum cinerariifolium]